MHPTWSGRSGPLAAKCGVGHSHVLAILTDFWLISLGFFRHHFQFRYGDWPWLAQYASVLPWLIFVWLLQRMALHHLRLPWWGFERGQQQFLGCYTPMWVSCVKNTEATRCKPTAQGNSSGFAWDGPNQVDIFLVDLLHSGVTNWFKITQPSANPSRCQALHAAENLYAVSLIPTSSAPTLPW